MTVVNRIRDSRAIPSHHAVLPVQWRYDRGQRDYIQSCNLPQVSWVIPNGDASDHPGMATETYSTEIEHGPAWVAAIINAVGNSWDQSKVNGQNHQCDYWGTHGTGSKYQPTVIMVVWDDWGGWWDHVNPETVPDLGVHLNCQDWGCGYSYGFRVPLLVVSAYTPAGYVSGATPDGPGMVFPYIHDFGSILAFTEKNFQLGQINSQYPFADHFAPELRHDPTAIPLADFFCSSPCTPRQFQPIPLAPGAPGPDYFTNYTGPITDPDDDAIDDD